MSSAPLDSTLVASSLFDGGIKSVAFHPGLPAKVCVAWCSSNEEGARLNSGVELLSVNTDAKKLELDSAIGGNLNPKIGCVASLLWNPKPYRPYLVVCETVGTTPPRIFQPFAGVWETVKSHDETQLSPQTTSAAFLPMVDGDRIVSCDGTELVVTEIDPTVGQKRTHDRRDQMVTATVVNRIESDAKTVVCSTMIDWAFMATIDSKNSLQVYDITHDAGERADEPVVSVTRPLLSEAIANIRLVTFHPLLPLFCCVTTDGRTASVYSRDANKITKEFDINPDSGSIVCIAFHPKEPCIAIGLENGYTQIWDVTKTSEEPLLTLPPTAGGYAASPASPSAVTSLDFHPSGHLLAIGNSNGAVTVFSTSPVIPPPGRASGGLGGSRRRQIRKTKRRKYRNTKRKCRSCRRK